MLELGLKRAEDDGKLIEQLEELFAAGAKLNGDKKPTVRCTRLTVPGTAQSVASWKFQEYAYGKPEKPLPTDARGLFSHRDEQGRQRIVVRGYDKFFNTDEVAATKWESIARDTTGPYTLTLKQNGCIIFVGTLPDGTLLVTSKHSLGEREDSSEAHATRGHTWLERHLAAAGRSEQELAAVLGEYNVTAVCELCDDDFEEHILAYPPEVAGLYLHGINANTARFQTQPVEVVDRFAAHFGLRRNHHFQVADLAALRALLDDAAQTGTYDGVEIEGFVVRTKRLGEDFLFKSKFEEPYLMYRQWREATKALIRGSPWSSYRKHEAITRRYIDFVRPLLKDETRAAGYQNNHGIIALREAFLKAQDRPLAEVLAEMDVDVDDVAAPPPKTVLVPIATIGCGKTTIALGLKRLFGFGHVQNDNITQKKPAAAFAKAVWEAAQSEGTKGIVVADRNNHMFHERESLVRDLDRHASSAGESIRFLCFYFEQSDAVRQAAEQRVLTRGDNHQSIRAITDGVDHVKMVMRGFHHRFQPIDTSRPPDDRFDHVVTLDATKGSRYNLERVVDWLLELGVVDEKPTAQQLDDAFQYALDYKPDVQKFVKSHPAAAVASKKADKTASKQQQQQSVNKAKTQTDAPKKPNFVGASVDRSIIIEALDRLLADVSVWRTLKEKRRVAEEFHCTLVHQTQAKSHAALWETYLAQRPSGERVQLHVTRAVWRDDLVCLQVELPPGIAYANAHPHITIGTVDSAVKPVASNDVMAALQEGDAAVQSRALDMMLDAEIKVYYR